MMNWILTISLVLVAVAVTASAQDLDSPRLGTAASVSDAGQSAATDLFSMMLARVLAAEAEYFEARRSQDWEHLWEWAIGSYELAEFFTGVDLRADLTPAEFAAFRAELLASAARLSAAGLN